MVQSFKVMLKCSYKYFGQEQRFGHCFLIILEMIVLKFSFS